VVDNGSRLDPIPSFRFTVRFDSLQPMGFSDCNGLSLETEVQDYHEGGLNTHSWKFVTRSKQGNLILKRGIVDTVMWNWYLAIVRGALQFRNGTITVQDPSGSNDVMEFQVLQAFPVKWVGPDLSASQNNLAVETLEFAHQGLQRIT
jgi:phage tail-like protein